MEASERRMRRAEFFSGLLCMAWVLGWIAFGVLLVGLFAKVVRVLEVG